MLFPIPYSLFPQRDSAIYVIHVFLTIRMNLNVLVLAFMSIPLWFIDPVFAANPDHIERLRETKQCPQCDLSNANLKDSNLFSANLVNANLRGANLSGANLGSANLTDANLTGANLSNAYLHKAILDSTNLSQADLSNAYLRDALILDAMWNKANLQGVNLNRTDLSGANLENINLSNANLSDAVFMGIDQRNVSLVSFYSMINPSIGLFSQELCQGNSGYMPLNDPVVEDFLSFAKLNGANLSGANLSGALLVGIDFNGANLTNANLINACLSYAKLNNVTLDNANLRNTQLFGAILENASLENVQNAELDGTYRSELEAKAAPKQTEAEDYITWINQTQQDYYLQSNKFAKNLDELGLWFPADTEFYHYQIVPQPDSHIVLAFAEAKEEGLKSYMGVVFVTLLETPGDLITKSYICQTEEPSTSAPATPIIPKNSSDDVQCPVGSRLLK